MMPSLSRVSRVNQMIFTTYRVLIFLYITVWFCLSSSEKAVAYFETTDQILDNEDDVLIQKSSCKTFCHYVNAINTAPRSIGKDGKFQILVCLGTRYRVRVRLFLFLRVGSMSLGKLYPRVMPIFLGFLLSNFYYETAVFSVTLCYNSSLYTHFLKKISVFLFCV